MLFGLIGFTSFSQNHNVTKQQVVEKENQFSLEKVNAEEALSFEEQGFVAIEENKKIIYRKEVNGIVIEFTPKEQ